MSITKAIEIVGGWPADRSAPRRLSELIEDTKGVERQQMGMLVEALIVASVGGADIALVGKYFDSTK